MNKSKGLEKASRETTNKQACQDDSSGGRKQFSDLEYIFKEEIIVFADILDMGCGRKNN